MFGGVGLGTFPLAGPFSTVTPDGAAAILDSYFEAGGVYLDTAPTYAFGSVEELLGQYLQDRPRTSFAVSTSCGYVRDGEGYRISGRRDDVLRDAEESLARLRLDHFDIYISHIPDPAVPLEETGLALQSLKDSGIATRIGVSNVDPTQLRRYQSTAEISVVQNRLSFANRTITAELEAAIVESKAEMVAYQVIERGLLTTAPKNSRREADLRNRKPEFEASRVQWIQEHLVEPLEAVAERLGVSVVSLVVGWVLAQPGVSLAQIGATNPAQSAIIPTLGRNVDAKSVRELDEIYDQATASLPLEGPRSIEAFLGIASYDVRSGSASGS